MWVDFVFSFLAPSGFSPLAGTLVFPSRQKPTFPNSNSTRNQVHEEPPSRRATSKSLFLCLSVILHFQTVSSTYCGQLPPYGHFIIAHTKMIVIAAKSPAKVIYRHFSSTILCVTNSCPKDILNHESWPYIILLIKLLSFCAVNAKKVIADRSSCTFKFTQAPQDWILHQFLAFIYTRVWIPVKPKFDVMSFLLHCCQNIKLVTHTWTSTS